MALVVITIDNTILNVALPTIVRELDATGSQLQWIVDSYVIVFACLLLTAGALGDKYGRKGALDVRRRVVRRVLRAGVVRDLARSAHRVPRPDGHRRRADLPDHAVDPHQHVHRPRAGARHRDLGGHLGHRHRDRPAGRRVPRRALLVGRGVPRERARVHHRVRRRRDLRAHVTRSRQPAARPAGLAPLDRHPGRPALRDHPGSRKRGGRPRTC